MSAISRGVSKAIFDWAQGFARYGATLRLNTVVQKPGEASLVTSTALRSAEYIDGTVDRTVYFTLVLVEPWSEGVDDLNEYAITLGEEWLDWVSAQAPDNLPDLGEGREVIELETDDDAPVLVQVMDDALVAKYQFQAHLVYRAR